MANEVALEPITEQAWNRITNYPGANGRRIYAGNGGRSVKRRSAWLARGRLNRRRAHAANDRRRPVADRSAVQFKRVLPSARHIRYGAGSVMAGTAGAGVCPIWSEASDSSGRDLPEFPDR